MKLPISVLDIGPIEEGRSPSEALQATLKLALHADQLGCQRFWVAEHHNSPNIATAAPAVILGVLGAATTRIRLGSGGVMLPNHAPLVVAEQFGTLSAYYPNRVDLGIGRAPGTNAVAAEALRRPPDSVFGDELRELLRYLTVGSAAVTAVPGQGSDVELWLLGSGLDSARLAAECGLRYAFAHHLKPQLAAESMELYRKEFRPSGLLGAPYTMVSVHVVCAEDDAEARWLADPAQLSFIRMKGWPTEGFPSPAEAAAYSWTADERAAADARQQAQAVGSPETVRRRLTDIVGATRPDELMVMNAVTDPAERAAALTRVYSLVS
ncbi:LLM class flavin-dependent oxidoreductase [Nocardia altamirensis]|uniref:LLM class flavin-dependent oxidoreductase n=1 Tax=Nocardia altamirensis TaxID=472158 RepID=UPI00084080E1|nr:LLM class flavin-dependent oxidoreductase [Nocardia altamirensis]